MVRITLLIADGATPRLMRLFKGIPRHQEQLKDKYLAQGKRILMNVLNQEFGSGNRLSRGVKSTKTAQGGFIEIQAQGKEGTTGAERLVAVLNYGSRPHPIRPRNPKGVLAMKKGDEGIVFRRLVRRHSVRGRRFLEKTIGLLNQYARSQRQKDIRALLEV